MNSSKTEIVVKAVASLCPVVITMVLLSSCIDFDLGGAFSMSTPIPGVYTPPVYARKPAFSIDSIRQDSASIYKVYTSVSSDSAIYLTGFQFIYWEEIEGSTNYNVNGNLAGVSHVSPGVPFRYEIQLSNLKPKSDYRICGYATHSPAGWQLATKDACHSFKTE